MPVRDEVEADEGGLIVSEITAMVEAIKGLEAARADPKSSLNKKEARKQWECEPCANPDVVKLLIDAFPEMRMAKAGLKGLPPCEGQIPLRICPMPSLPPPKRRRKKKVEDEAAVATPT